MRIKAKIEISNRSLAVHNLSGRKGKDAQALLAIGKKPKGLVQSTLKESNKKDKETREPKIFLMVSTVENRAGTKYAITFAKYEKDVTSNGRNIEKIFDRFIDEGKATIRFSDPPHDLCIKKADSVQLKSFIKLLKKVIELSTNKTMEDELEKLLGENNSLLSALNPPSQKQVAKEKTRMVIANKKDYPITTSFPSSLLELRANSINLKRIDSRIFKLQSLSILDLSNNSIARIPQEITGLSCLKELILSQNKIEAIPAKFCENSIFCSSLRLLDLGENLISSIHPHLSRFANLVTLKLNDNPFSRLPPSIFGAKLRSLNLNGCSKLINFPGTALNLRLDHLYASRLHLLFEDNNANATKTVLNTTANIPTLLDIVSRKILLSPKILNAMKYENAVPEQLVVMVESMVKCFCGQPCARSSCAVAISRFPVKRMTSNLECEYLGHDAMAKFETVFCSGTCLKRYGKNQFAI